MLESQYQAELCNKLKRLFPGIVIIKQDANVLQGVPDLILLYQTKWAMLEVKASEKSKTRPNQAYYIQEFGEMSYASFVFPENEEEVLNALRETFRA